MFRCYYWYYYYIQHTDGPLQVKHWGGVLTPVTPAALTPMLRRAPPTAADRQGGRQPVVQFPLGEGGGRTRRPPPPVPRIILAFLGHLCHLRACIILASLTTRSYNSTETQRAAHLNAGMNRYPDFYQISRFDIRINEKFDINITNTYIHTFIQTDRHRDIHIQTDRQTDITWIHISTYRDTHTYTYK